MSAHISIACRFLALASLLPALHGSPSPAQPATSGTSPSLAQRYYPEVRLRKLHLVRPDLIPYPISFDVYC